MATAPSDQIPDQVTPREALKLFASFYREHAERLIASGHAYRCFCTPEELDAKRQAAGLEYRYDRKCRAIPRAESDARAYKSMKGTLVVRGLTGGDELVVLGQPGGDELVDVA
mgnify:CR=1 FL=1